MGGLSAPLPTPCTGVCRLDADRCIGCGRTLDEIGRWATMGAAERAQVMRRVASR